VASVGRKAREVDNVFVTKCL